MLLDNIQVLLIKQKINLNYQDFQLMKNMERLERFKNLLKTIPFPYKKLFLKKNILNKKIILQM